jgi:hypothetical protein
VNDLFANTLADARGYVLAKRDEGVVCPCCNQFAKCYRRKLNSSMVRGLIYVYHLYKRLAWSAGVWLHLPQFFASHRICTSNDGSLLRHWGLIEPRPGVRLDGSKRVGYYRITTLGRAFVEKKATVPKFAVLYSQELLDMEGPSITVDDALASRFSYEELMSRGTR